MPNAKVMTLRPRLTIHPTLHPELYEKLSNIEPEILNALVFQMLIKQAYLEKYMSTGVTQGYSAVEQTQHRKKSPPHKGAAGEQLGAAGPSNNHEDEHKHHQSASIVAETPAPQGSVHSVDAIALKGALAGLSLGL